MHDIRILAVPREKYSAYKHGAGFLPSKDSADFWVLQVRLADNPNEWLSVPVVQYVEE